MTKFQRYIAMGATLCLSLFVGGGCSDDDTGAKPPHYDKPITIKQTGKNYVSYHIEVEEDVTYRHLITSKQEFINFTTGSTTEQDYDNAVRLLLNLDAGKGTGPQDFVLRDLDKKPLSNDPHSVVAGIEYVGLLCPADAKGNCIGDYEMIEFKTPAPTLLSQNIKVEITALRPDEVDLTITPDAGILYFFEQVFPKKLADEIAAGGEDKLREQLLILGSRIFEFDKLSEWMNLYGESDYLHLVLGIDKEGNQTRLIETPFKTPKGGDVNTENLVFDQSPEAYYYGQSTGDDGGDIYCFYFTLSDQPMSEDDNGKPYPTAFPCNAITCDLYAAAPAAGEPKIPEGTYTFSESYVAGIWHPGDSEAVNFDGEENKTEFSLSAGTIDVAYEGDGYRITFDMKTENGQAYTGTFTGTIPFLDESSYAPVNHVVPAKKHRK